MDMMNFVVWCSIDRKQIETNKFIGSTRWVRSEGSINFVRTRTRAPEVDSASLTCGRSPRLIWSCLHETNKS
jgi:hypothetical protein